MRKIESIIDNCKECKWRVRYASQVHGNPDVFICERLLQRGIPMACFENQTDIPDWCPLETYNEVDPVVASSGRAQGIILSGMPNLEWITENLSGYGGTEIDGNWYYTWEQAKAAAAELGDGWRLPTRAEFEQLCKLESTWDDDRKGRVFGGKLYLASAGSLSSSTGAVSNVASEGYYWSSSPFAGDTYAGYLNFDSGGVYPLGNYLRAYGFTVRCVREL